MIAKLLAIVLIFAVATSAYNVDVGTEQLGEGEPFQFTGEAADWYAYSTTHGASADSHHMVEKEDGIVVSVVHTDDGFHVAVILDAPGSEEVVADGGSATMTVECGHSEGEAVFQACRDALLAVVQYDDDSEFFVETAPGSGVFTISWGWVECCTDGIMVGPFNSASVDITFTVTESTGLTEKSLYIAYDDNGETNHHGPYANNAPVHLYNQFSDVIQTAYSCECKAAQVSSDSNTVTLEFAEDGVVCEGI